MIISTCDVNHAQFFMQSTTLSERHLPNITIPNACTCVIHVSTLFASSTLKTFTRFVEAGRVALVNYGEHLNKLVVIVDILDQNRVLVDAPSHGITRRVQSIKRLALTSIKLDNVKRGDSVEDVKKAYKDADVDGVFAASSWGQKLSRQQKRRNLDDFGRFKVMVARIKKSKAVNAQLAKVKA